MHDTFTLEKENERLTARVAELEEDLEQHSENWRVKAGHLEQERDRLRESLKYIESLCSDDCELGELTIFNAIKKKCAALHPTEPAPEAN